MKPLTKTVVSQGGGIAARFVSTDKSAVVTDVSIHDGGSTFVAKVKREPPDPTNKPRYERWRDKNPELYRQRQAEYMRKRRAKERTTNPD